MSWFEKARTVLVQALEIHEEPDDNTDDSTAAQSLPRNPSPGSSGSNTALQTPTKSVPGAFYDSSNANEMVTTPPRATIEHASTPTQIVPLPTSSALTASKRLSTTSNSIDVLPSPSDCENTMNNSESMDIITTGTELELSPDTESSLPDSIVVITSNETSDNADSEEHEFEESQLTNSHLIDSTNTVKGHLADSDGIKNMTKAAPSVDSDSTQSFEDIQMLSSGQKYKAEKVDFIDHSYSSTSSDIEVISNPNGDSNSNNSFITRISPSRLHLSSSKQLDNSTTASNTSSLKIKGHYREPSEVSILSEDSEVERLASRIAELNHIIELREQRLLQSERQNSELQEQNQELQATLDNLRGNTSHSDANHETVQQLSALEKKFQASIRERDALRIQIKSLTDELQRRIPAEELNESKDMIAALQCEGEKLSKEILQQSNIIKKLRAKEKTSDTLLKKNGEQISLLSSETDRLKKTLSAKEEVERAQIEAVHKISLEKRKADEENAQYHSQIEDLQSKLAALQKSFDGVKAELKTRTRQEQDQFRNENLELTQQVNDLREKLRSSEQAASKREQLLREENRELLRRLEGAELRAEANTQDIGQSTAPLIRQIESLQRTLNQRASAWNADEQSLLRRLDSCQMELKSFKHLESSYKEKEQIVLARCNILEEQLSTMTLRAETAESNLRQLEMQSNNQEQDYKWKIKNLETEISNRDKSFEDMEKRIKELEETLQKNKRNADKANELALSDIEGVNLEHVSDIQRQVKNSLQQIQHAPSACSLVDSFCNEEISGPLIDWHNDDLDCVSNNERQPGSIMHGVHLNFLANNTTTLEHLQSLLKQRDGELMHLQWELSRVQAERAVLSDEITNLTMELETAKEKLEVYGPMVNNFEDLKHRYNALLQMYGEKVERTEELELDLVELKQAYKLQIDELLAQPCTEKLQNSSV